MQKVIATSTATRPTGSPPQRKLLKVATGPYAGRIAALYAVSANGIALRFSDYPYNIWSNEQAIAGDSSDTSFSACIDSSGHIYVAYSDTNNELKMRKLTFSAGQWSVGAASTIVNSDDSYRPVILKDNDDKLWCIFDHHRLSYDARHYVRAKSSADDGATWGSGPSDLGTSLSSAWIEPAYISASLNASRLYVIYCAGHSHVMLRICDLLTATWQAEAAICDVANIDDRFDAAISSDGKIGIVMTPPSGGIHFKEHDGLAWSGLIEIEAADTHSPQIYYAGASPHVVYMILAGTGYYIPRHATGTGGEFAAEDVSPSFGAFDKVFVFYSSGSPQFQDKTAAAANITEGDICHSGSQGLLDLVGDCFYLGRLAKFNRASIILSSTGLGGEVAWEYWNGVTWVEFEPYSGAFDFDQDDALVQFWQDLSAAPSDWQMGSVNGFSAFWVRARTTLGYSINPIGTQILAGCKLEDISLARPASTWNGAGI